MLFSGQVQLTDHSASNSSPIWSPDGATIYYFANHRMDIIGAKTGTYAIETGGGAPRKIAKGRLCAISPDGTALAYVEGTFTSVPGESSYEAAKTVYKAYLINTDGSGRRRSLGTVDGAEAIKWSPNGDRIAYLQNGALYLIGGDGQGKKTRLVNKVAAFSWSQDGSMLACQEDGGGGLGLGRLLGSNKLFVIDSVNGTKTELTDGSSDTRPLWSPR